MNPVLASSLVTVGKSFIEKLSPPSSITFNPSSNFFSTELETAKSNNYNDLPISNLRENLLEDPNLKAFLNANSGNEIYFQKRADGGSQILSSSGDSLVLPKGSQTNSLVQKYFDQCIKQGVYLSAHRPGTVLLTGS